MIYSGPLAPITILSDPHVGGPSASILMRREISTRDLSEFGGAGRIAGTVKVDSTPDYAVWRRVRLFDRRNNALVRESWSNPVTGAYSFEGINPARTYVVIAYDHTGVFNAEIRDSVTPEAML